MRVQPHARGQKGCPTYGVPPGAGSSPQQHGNNWVIVSVPPGTRVRWGIQQTHCFLPVPLAFPAQANPIRCPISTATAPQPARTDSGSRPPSAPPSPPGTIQGQRCCGNAAPAAPTGPKVGADKGAASASSSRFRDSANGVHLLGSSWNNKFYHPKKRNHKRGSACSPAHKSPLSGGPPRPPISRRKLNLTKINSAPSPVLSGSPQQTAERRGSTRYRGWQTRSPSSPRARGIPAGPGSSAVPLGAAELLTSPSQALHL